MKLYLTLLLASNAISMIAAKCNEICHRIYRPVCGFNGSCYKTFGNECLFDSKTCKEIEAGRPGYKLVYRSECRSQNLPVCTMPIFG
ncbi:turripeptide Gsg9.2-like [Scaptodrosophila lebanonensis]|uniref:Turripeptide Gsg9.2-like n=1 Tax=Drosophila lebanonensis TaxID=7225 RepID=A0A6J2UCD4_DROLE|nr:turripeptide Gsg9.2-like [Scaptodrosophila lebanonensis]